MKDLKNFDKLLEKPRAEMSPLEYSIIQIYDKGERENAEQAAAELADYELRLDLLAKGATWEHEENERMKEELSALRAEVERLKEGRDAKIEKIKAVLRFVEWHGNNDGWECCPYCYGFYTHDDKCELAAALNAPSEGQKRE